eukprot:CAMPEP_0196802172 /NCGR_PEP_ID=MMETSP1362-20130617/1837_1 /TAXON_ID=163516 /ORGANISM="Leptocylindrus danicus, Strain CCMP1856" /LENGTH=410 /DNA_ID=CAMNT_0042173393 /DNA_START=1804 /DNA_END=3036 /DNA_ORIENTATION=-
MDDTTCNNCNDVDVQQEISCTLPKIKMLPNDAIDTKGSYIRKVNLNNKENNKVNNVAAEKQQGEESSSLSELIAVIISIRYGTSYDTLFTDVQQKSEQGTHVNTYLVQDMDPNELLKLCCMNLDEKRFYIERDWGKDACDMLTDINSVDPDSVVFNWECCCGCGDHGFDNKVTPMPLFSYLLHERSFMVMCSDFSLKALIHEWDDEILGVNPLKKVGTFSSRMVLRFDPKKLQGCEDSTQLQMLGELCKDSGEASVHALGGTIAYTIDSNVTPQSHPNKSVGWTELEVLTFATELDGNGPESYTRERNELLSFKESSALPGHCLLRFPSTGRLLVSCPHWIELSRLDVSKESLFQVAQDWYGAAECASMAQEYGAIDNEEERNEYVQKKSRTFIQQSAPSKSRKKKWHRF